MVVDQPCILKLEKFQAEIGRRILHLSKFHSRLSVLLALRWPSMRARILNIKLSYFHRLLTSDIDSLGTRTFNTLASIDVYKLGLTQQCLFLDSKVGSGTVAELLSNPDSATFHLKQAKANIIKLDWKTSVEMAAARSSTSAIIDTNCCLAVTCSSKCFQVAFQIFVGGVRYARLLQMMNFDPACACAVCGLRRD